MDRSTQTKFTGKPRKPSNRNSSCLVIEAGDKLELPGMIGLWQVVSGSCIVTIEYADTRYRIADLEELQYLPLADQPSDLGRFFISTIQGVTLNKTTLRSKKATLNETDLTHLFAGFDGYFRLFAPTSSALTRHANAGDRFTTKNAVILTSPAELVWLRVPEGEEINLCGICPLQGGDQLIPLHGNLWAEVSSGGSVEIISTQALIDQSTAAGNTAYFMGLLPDLLVKAEKYGDRRILDRIKDSIADRRQQLMHGLSHLEAISPGNYKNVRTKASAAAVGALVHAVASFGVEFQKKYLSLPGDDLSAIPQVARASGIRVRKILLPENWWTTDCGTLIAARTKLDDKGNKKELGLLSLTRVKGRYVAHDPDTGKTEPVTDELAAEVSRPAYAIYPSFPKEIFGFRRIGQFLYPLIKPDLTALITIGILLGLIGALTPLATALIIDSLIPSSDISLLTQVGIALAISAVLQFVLSVAKGIATTRISSRSSALMQAALWDRVLKLPVGFFKDYSAGDLSQRVAGFNQIRALMLNLMLTSVYTVLFSGFYLILLLFYDLRLAALTVGFVLVLMAITFVAGYMQIKYIRRAAVVEGWLSGFVFQVLQGIVKLRVAGGEARAFARWMEKYTEERQVKVAFRNLSNHYTAFSGIYATLTLATTFGVVFYFSRSNFTPGTLIAFLAAANAFQSAFMGLNSAALSFFTIMPNMERIEPLLTHPLEDREDAEDPGVLSGSIEVSRVNFSYEDGPPVLKDFSLKIAPGEHIAIVGESGSGKSTLFRILLGFEQPSSGTVLYDGQDLASLDPKAVRRQIGIVLQNGRIFAGTMYENIKGASTATLEDCEHAAHAAGLSSDLEQFPMGLHTPLTEGAPTISGGQRQRILIARALASKPNLLFMDEATSALDNRTQRIVTESLNKLSVTRIVIAHRLSTIRNADRILVLDKGKVVEQGSFDEVMNLNGLFAEFANRQIK